MNRTSLRLAFVATLLSAAASAQDLRHALGAADAVLAGRQVGKRAFSDDVDLHRVQVVRPIRGVRDGATAVVVIDWPKVSLHNRPQPRQSRLYCLQSATTEAARLGLPEAEGPYFRMVGHAGSNPLVQVDSTADGVLRFCELHRRIDAGEDPRDTAVALFDMALGDDAEMRLEAAMLLAEQPIVRSRVPELRWSEALSRAAAETNDIRLKIALAELCAEQRLPGLVDALVVGLDTLQQPDYARAVGRVCRRILGEDAARPLLVRLQTNANSASRSAQILALGATRTEAALDALLQLKQQDSKDAAVDAGLREHGSRRAREAAAPRERKPGGADGG